MYIPVGQIPGSSVCEYFVCVHYSTICAVSLSDAFSELVIVKGTCHTMHCHIVKVMNVSCVFSFGLCAGSAWQNVKADWQDTTNMWLSQTMLTLPPSIP
jgi:hypothetical protein